LLAARDIDGKIYRRSVVILFRIAFLAMWPKIVGKFFITI
jgi:hypothetical protein